MGNGHSSSTLAAHATDLEYRKRSCSANASPRKLPLHQVEQLQLEEGSAGLILTLSPRQTQRSLRIEGALPPTHDIRRKTSVGLPPQRRRMSVDEQAGTRRFSRSGKLSLAGKEEMLNSRRVSRAAIHFSETGDFGLTLVEQLKLTSYQTLMIQQNWMRIKGTVFVNLFKNLASRNAKVREVFQKMSILEGFSASKCCDMKEHQRSLVDLFETAIGDFNNSGKAVQNRCLQIGEAHLSLVGPNASGMWDDLGDCLTEAISKTEPVRGKREALRAWISLISFLVDSMRGGYMAQCKRQSISRPHETGLAALSLNENGAASG